MKKYTLKDLLLGELPYGKSSIDDVVFYSDVTNIIKERDETIKLSVLRGDMCRQLELDKQQLIIELGLRSEEELQALEKENELLRKQIQCDSVDEGCNLYEETGVVCYRHLHHFYETTSKQIKENHDRAEEIIKGREKTIAHLHEQLAEKDARIKALTQGDPCWYDMNEADAFRMWAADRVKLAEKEKEVERLTQLHMSVYNEACDDLKSTFALERLLLEQKVRELEEEKEVLTECLNGSSKAHYTAELYDKGITEAHATGRREGIEESATLVEERERKRWEQVGDPRTPSFTPYYAIAIRKAAQQS